jgi:hypothetical protein
VPWIDSKSVKRVRAVLSVKEGVVQQKGNYLAKAMADML